MNENKIIINKCPGTLKSGFTTYSLKTIKEVFGGVRVSHILNYMPPHIDQMHHKELQNDRTRISISGVQEKYSFRREHKTLFSTDKNGEYILKPIPTDLLYADQVPANEHLTMQIASQVFRLNVAKNALIFFKNGSPAYITKRFDILDDGARTSKEDFASLAQKTSLNAGKNYKYDYSYASIAKLIDQYLPTNIAQKEAFFKLIIFNFLFCNGDAHLKNFSVIDYSGIGDYALAPAYDLINTRLHIDDSVLALKEGLYPQDYEHPSYSTLGHYAYDDFLDFGIKIGLVKKRVARFIENLSNKTENVTSLIDQSFLNQEMKNKYLSLYLERKEMLLTKL